VWGLYGFAEVLNNPTRRGHAGLQCSVDTHTAPTLGPFGTGEEHPGSGVFEVIPAVAELTSTQGAPRLARPFIGHPVMPCGVDYFKFRVELVHDFLCHRRIVEV